MTINEIKELVYRVSNTSMSGNVSPEDFNLFLMRMHSGMQNLALCGPGVGFGA